MILIVVTVVLLVAQLMFLGISIYRYRAASRNVRESRVAIIQQEKVIADLERKKQWLEKGHLDA